MQVIKHNPLTTIPALMGLPIFSRVWTNYDKIITQSSPLIEMIRSKKLENCMIFIFLLLIEIAINDNDYNE